MSTSRLVTVALTTLALTTLALAYGAGEAVAASGSDDGSFDSGGGASLGDEGTVELWAVDVDDRSVDTRPVLGSPSECQVESVRDDFERERALRDNALVPMRAQFYLWVCGEATQLRWFVPGVTEAGTDPALAPLVDEALSRVAPLPPELVLSPPVGSEVLTGLPMYVAVDEGAFAVRSGSVSAGQFRVSAVVRPVEVWFVPGDGEERVVCEGRGSVWGVGDRPGPGDCTWTFVSVPEGGGVFELSAGVVYEASYTVEGPVLAGEYELGRFEGPQVVVSVPVVERRAVRTGG